MKADLSVVTQGDQRIISFMSQCVGLPVDTDLGTDHLRWMGDTRFVYGYIREGISLFYKSQLHSPFCSPSTQDVPCGCLLESGGE